jgi:hypothetical protein
MVTRQVIEPLELSPLLNVRNRVEVIFRGCTPEPITEPRQAAAKLDCGLGGASIPRTLEVSPAWSRRWRHFRADVGHGDPGAYVGDVTSRAASVAQRQP